MMSEYLRWRPQIDMWTDLDDTTHPFVVFPDPCGPALRAIDRVGHVGPLGTGLGALEQEQGMGQLTAALRWLQTCAFPVESGGGRWNSESP